MQRLSKRLNYRISAIPTTAYEVNSFKWAISTTFKFYCKQKVLLFLHFWCTTLTTQSYKPSSASIIGHIIDPIQFLVLVIRRAHLSPGDCERCIRLLARRELSKYMYTLVYNPQAIYITSVGLDRLWANPAYCGRTGSSCVYFWTFFRSSLGPERKSRLEIPPKSSPVRKTSQPYSTDHTLKSMLRQWRHSTNARCRCSQTVARGRLDMSIKRSWGRGVSGKEPGLHTYWHCTSYKSYIIFHETTKQHMTILVHFWFIKINSSLP